MVHAQFFEAPSKRGVDTTCEAAFSQCSLTCLNWRGPTPWLAQPHVHAWRCWKDQWTNPFCGGSTYPCSWHSHWRTAGMLGHATCCSIESFKLDLPGLSTNMKHGSSFPVIAWTLAKYSRSSSSCSWGWTGEAPLSFANRSRNTACLANMIKLQHMPSIHANDVQVPISFTKHPSDIVGPTGIPILTEWFWSCNSKHTRFRFGFRWKATFLTAHGGRPGMSPRKCTTYFSQFMSFFGTSNLNPCLCGFRRRCGFIRQNNKWLGFNSWIWQRNSSSWSAVARSVPAFGKLSKHMVGTKKCSTKWLPESQSPTKIFSKNLYKMIQQMGGGR